MKQKVLSEKRMYAALLARDPEFDGLFVVGVRTTGIFCRSTCSARKPKRENVEFFGTPREALARGYRPCKVCRPLAPRGEAPAWVQRVLQAVETNPQGRMRDTAIRALGVDPNRLRRWFKKTHNMTFQAYLRSLRLGRAFGRLAVGEKVIDTAFGHGYESLSGFADAYKKIVRRGPRASVGGKIIHICQILTPLGPLLAGSVEEGICLLEFTDRRMLERQLAILQKRLAAPLVTSVGPYFRQLEKELQEYFRGERREFGVPLVLPGSDFQRKVWAGLQRIPYGETRSYQDQARAIGCPKAVRAVGRANGENRIAILVPCHRVIGANGEPVGYGGGVWRKKFLLDLERGFKS